MTTISGSQGVSAVQDGTITVADLVAAAAGASSPGRVWYSTVKSAASGTAITFAAADGLPAWATEIDMLLYNVTGDSTQRPIVQIGNAGTPITAGYDSAGEITTLTGTGAITDFTTGFGIDNNGTANFSIIGVMKLRKLGDTNTWLCNGEGKVSNDYTWKSYGALTLAGALDIVRLTWVSAQNFDGGSVALVARG